VSTPNNISVVTRKCIAEMHELDKLNRYRGHVGVVFSNGGSSVTQLGNVPRPVGPDLVAAPAPDMGSCTFAMPTHSLMHPCVLHNSSLWLFLCENFVDLASISFGLWWGFFGLVFMLTWAMNFEIRE